MAFGGSSLSRSRLGLNLSYFTRYPAERSWSAFCFASISFQCMSRTRYVTLHRVALCSDALTYTLRANMLQTNLAVTKDTQFVIQPMRPSLIILLSVAILVATLPALVTGQAPNNAQTPLVGFSLNITPGTLSVQNGSSANAAIIVTSQGLNGPVNLDASVSPSSGLQAAADPSRVMVLPGGNAASTLEINATSAQVGDYQINVTGSVILTPSRSFIVTVHVTASSSQPPVSPPSSPPAPGTSGPNNQQPSTTTSGSNPKGPSTPKGQGSPSIFDPVGVIVAGNLLAAVGTIGAIASMYRKRSNPSHSSS